ncbi:hypothetical protein [Actinomycetospora sp. NBRC 106378]|uniref:hypothetical protein n=1 Tax=Actinomycetospora sp. NBRC 106378 TaxID=3032208 RepID=UPI0024A3BEEE|nr:hypothetical protein [Actinomycetospora sp. NBRC 106378]GLZ56389.1 hypothetical protein Acsp07_60060 [Actinomycetospora sp. NBRC 106378]
MGEATEDGTNPVRRAVGELLHVAEHGRDLCPPGRDSQEWANGVLYDFARVAELLDGAVERVSGRRNETVADNAHSPATVISAHRNLEVGRSAS